MPDAKDRLLWATELLDLAEHLICILETGDRAVVVQFAVTDLKAVGEAVARFHALDDFPVGFTGTRRAHAFRVSWLLPAQPHAKAGDHRYGRF